LRSKIVGHGDPAFTQRVYQRYRDADGQHAAEALDALLGGILAAAGGDNVETPAPPTVVPLPRRPR